VRGDRPPQAVGEAELVVADGFGVDVRGVVGRRGVDGDAVGRNVVGRLTTGWSRGGHRLRWPLLVPPVLL
jgi:hypothetical protein